MTDTKTTSKLAKRREALGRSLAEQAIRLGISRQYLHNIEIGKRTLPDERVDAFADAYELTRDDVYLHAGKIPPDLEAAIVKLDVTRLRFVRKYVAGF